MRWDEGGTREGKGQGEGEGEGRRRKEGMRMGERREGK